MIDIALRGEREFVSLKDIAERQGISKKYLEQIVPSLTKAGMLETNRGAQGGYRLALPPSECMAGEILRVAEGGMAPVACLEQSPNSCSRCADCYTLPLWEGLDKAMRDYLDGVSIQDLIDIHDSQIRAD